MSEEYAGARRVFDFPAEWGCPPGSTYSTERAAWVRDRVIGYMRVAELRGRLLTGPRARLMLLAKRWGPGDGPEAR